MVKPKTSGRLSREEMAAIENFAGDISASEIAKRLNRSIEPIVKYMEKVGKGATRVANFATQAEYDLKSRPYWKQLVNQFDQDEIDLFLYHWKTIVAQFHKDILPTEEMQIVDMVKLDVLMNRALNTQKENMRRIQVYEDMAVKESRKEERDQELVFNLEKQVAILKAAHETLSREYKDLQDKKLKMFTQLKATREQRIEKLESNKETFAGLINKLIRDPEFVADANREMEMMRLAVAAEKARLSDYHTYEDGDIDSPLLNAETVIGHE